MYVMTREQIVTEMAERREVERLVLMATHHRHLTPDLQDLCQMIYLILLEYDESRLLDRHACGKMQALVMQIIKNQYFSSTSPYFHTIREGKNNDHGEAPADD